MVVHINNVNKLITTFRNYGKNYESSKVYKNRIFLQLKVSSHSDSTNIPASHKCAGAIQS